MQDLALDLVESHEVHTGLLPKFVQVPLDSLPSFCHVNGSTQFGVACKPAEGALVLAKPLVKKLNSTGPSMDP